MATVENPPAIPQELLAEMQARAERAVQGIRDPEDVRRACERMDRMREELRWKVGETDIAVELIRDARNSGLRGIRPESFGFMRQVPPECR